MVNPSEAVLNLQRERIVFVEEIARTYGARYLFHRGTPDIAPPEWLNWEVSENFQYTPPLGYDGLREAVAEYYNSRANTRISKDDVAITVGSSDALLKIWLYFFLESPGAIMMPEIMWTIPETQVSLFTAGTPVFYKLKNNLPDLEDLKSRIEKLERNGLKTKGVYVNFPSNPTGKILKESTPKELAQLAEEKDLAIVSDEVYNELYFGKKPISMLDYAGDRVFVVNSASKTFGMTGERVGYVITKFPGAIQTFYDLMRYSNVCAPAYNQNLLLQALTDSRRDEYIERNRETYRRRRDIMIEEFSRTNKLNFEIPEGTFYMWADTGIDGEFLMKKLMELGVSVTPGKYFAYSTSLNNIESVPNPIADNFLRIALTIPDEDVRTGARIIVDYIEELYEKGIETVSAELE